MTADHRAAWKDAITAATPERLIRAAQFMGGVDLGIDSSHS
jgi:hypothetical protein